MGISNEVRGHAHPRPGGICGSRNTCLELIVRLHPARMEIGGVEQGVVRAGRIDTNPGRDPGVGPVLTRLNIFV